MRWALQRRAMTLGVRIAALDGQGRVMLVRHTYTPGWYLPGGGVEKHESALSAILRELAEEANVVATSPPALFGIYRNLRPPQRDHVLLYVARDVQPERPARTGPRDCRGAIFQRLMPCRMKPPTPHARRLAEVLGGQATVGNLVIIPLVKAQALARARGHHHQRPPTSPAAIPRAGWETQSRRTK